MSRLDWHVGMKVVCVDAAFTQLVDEREIEEGQVYTISWIGPYHHPMIGDFIGVRLSEVPRPASSPGEEAWFRAFGEMPFHHERFRPVQTRKTDISVFTAMLNKTTVWA